jgi:response regulator of citrate/malate metabolism
MASTDSAAPGGQVRTVIVDDDPAAQRLHARYLADVGGFAIAGFARTGTAAAELVLQPGVDLVLLDMNLPDFSGIEVLHRLRIVRDWKVDVIVLSSARDTFTVRQALSAHVAGYLIKPFTRELFVERLTAYRETRRLRREESGVSLGQGDIDAIAAGVTLSPVGPRHLGELTGPTPEAALPKGVSAATLQLVIDALDTVVPLTVREVAERVGASVPTARRYLDHLVRSGAASVSHRFGAKGRPEVLYRRAPV